MEPYVLSFLAGLLVTGVALAVMCLIAPKVGLVDHPAGRKSHRLPTPVVGGVAIVVGGLVSAGLLIAFLPGGGVIIEVLKAHSGFLIGASLLAIIGVLDDHTPIRPRVKLGVQFLACCLAVLVDGAVIGNYELVFESVTLSIEPIMIPFSILVMLTITNAINMIDGADGLAAGIALIALTIFAKATVTANFEGAALVTALTGALMAFLAFNFPILKDRPAKAFLGDCGSLLCGFTLAYMAIELSALPNRVFKPTTALWLFFLPVADTIWLYLRRTWYGRAPFAAGRDHIHYLLMARFSPRTVTWILVGASGVMAGGAYLAERLGVLGWVLFLVWVAAFLLYGLLTHKAWRIAWQKSRQADDAARPAVASPATVDP